MKKMLIACITVITVLLCSATAGFAYEMEYDTFPDWKISIASPADEEAVFDSEEGNYYIYTMDFGSIPFVMVKPIWDYESEEDLVYGFFLDAMKASYDDLYVISDLAPVTIRGRDGYEIDLGYTIQGYPVLDRRIFKTVGDITYMFCSKEVGELEKTLGTVLDDVFAESIFLEEPEVNPDTKTDAGSKDTFNTRSGNNKNDGPVENTGNDPNTDNEPKGQDPTEVLTETIDDVSSFQWDYDDDGVLESISISFTNNGDTYHSFNYIVITESDGSTTDAYLEHTWEIVDAQIITIPGSGSFLLVQTGTDAYGIEGTSYGLIFEDGELLIVQEAVE